MNFDKVRPNDIIDAVEDFKLNGYPNGFRPSSTYDVIIEGEKYPPKTIMAYASQRSSGQKPINDFEGGEGTLCFSAFNKNGFLIQRKDDIKSLIKEFLGQANTENLTFGHYPKVFFGMKLKVSFGKGNPAKIPWAGFLLGDNTIQKGIYPVFLFFKEIKYLILAYGISETEISDKQWEGLDDHLKITDWFKSKLNLTPFRYGESYIKGVYNLNEEIDFNRIEDDFKSIASVYKELNDNHNFSWVTTYKSISQYLKDKQDDQKSLIQLLKDSGCDIFNDQNPEGNVIELNEIDPFTFFCYLNKYFKQRLEILQNLAKKINAPLPKDDYGIPSTNPRKVWMFPYKFMRDNNEIDRLWKFFHKALDNKISDELFEDVLQIRGVAKAKITEALFYVDPETYFPINGPTKPYMEEVLGISPIFKTFSEYKSILDLIKFKSEKPFYQLSYEAWQWNNNKDEDLKDFKNSISKNNDQDLEFYFDYLQELTYNLNLNEGDERVVFSCKGDYLNFNIGQRVSWRLDPKNRRNKLFHIMTDKKINENSSEFEGSPNHYYHVFNEKDDLRSIKTASINASKNELARTVKSGFRKHNNKYFEKALYDKTFRSEYLKTKGMRNEETAIDLNQIFFGPPGTGKTFHTINEAIKIADPEFYKIHKNDREKLKARFKLLSLNNDNESDGQIGFTTFHQSYSYEDFIEGIKPNEPKEGDKFLKYEIQEGVFKKICRLAEDSLNAVAKNPKNFVLIVDEINRGNVSSVFGELITLIEKNKRAGAKEELRVTLPYSKETFSVPQNVYIIGTMNTADRSIEALDTALRRRFSFREMPPKHELIKTVGSLKSTNGKLGDIDLVKILNIINNRIEKLIDKDHKIGHSYFLNISSKQDLIDTFRDKVIPLLEEYFFGDFGKISLVLGSSFISKESADGVTFASFNDYDSSLANDLLERSVYKITSERNWDFKAIYE